MKRKPTYKELQARILELEKQLAEKRSAEKHSGPSSAPASRGRVLDENHVRTRKELIDQLRFVETLFNTVPNPVFYKNRHGVYLGCNASFSEQILGIPPERIIGRTLYDLPEVIPKTMADVYHRQDQDLLHNPGTQFYETKVRCADGVFRDFLFYKATYNSSSGEVAGLVGLMLDVTERKRIQLELWESKEKYRSMMESMSDAVYICAPDNRISYMNPKMIEQIGFDATGKKCHEALHNLEQPCAWCTFARVREGEITEIEVTSPRDRRVYIVTNSPVYHQDGTISKMTIYRDITRRKRIEEELLTARKLEATGLFAGGIVHDYNNLLLIILGNLLMLKKGIDVSSELYSLLQSAEEAAQKTAKLTRRLLVFTHGESLSLEKHDIKTVLEDVVCGLDQQTQCSVDLRVLCGALPVRLDASLFTIVMNNVITNAKEAMVAGGNIDIAVTEVVLEKESAEVQGGVVEKPGRYVRIAVKDTGTGIPEEILPRIFDPYFSTRQRGAKKGLGLGLSISYSIMKKHEGALILDSKEGFGTTVSILLPVASA